MAPTTDDNLHQRRTKHFPPERSNILKRFYALYDDKTCYYKNYKKKVSKLYWLFNRNPASVPIWVLDKKTFRKKITAGKRLMQCLTLSQPYASWY